MRLIDADSLMKKVCEGCPRNDCTPDATDTVYGCMFADSIDSMPTIESEPVRQKLIPCSERLPEYGEEVLVWFEYFRYGEYNRLYQTHGIGQFFGKDGKRESWLINHETGWQKLKVYAWMPLPNPYEEKE